MPCVVQRFCIALSLMAQDWHTFTPRRARSKAHPKSDVQEYIYSREIEKLAWVVCTCSLRSAWRQSHCTALRRTREANTHEFDIHTAPCSASCVGFCSGWMVCACTSSVELRQQAATFEQGDHCTNCPLIQEYSTTAIE